MEYKPSYKYIPPISWHILTPLHDFSCNIIGLGRKFKQEVLDSISLNNNNVIADIGCGTGVFLEIAKEKYPEASFIGVDPDEKSLTIARERFKKAKLIIELKEGFAECLPLADSSVNICFSTLAFHHMPDDIKRKAIQEMHRILISGGTVVIADFGKSTGILFKLFHIFQKIEYIKGNFDGLIIKYLDEVGFKNTRVVGNHFPGIQVIKSQKI